MSRETMKARAWKWLHALAIRRVRAGYVWHPDDIEESAANAVDRRVMAARKLLGERKFWSAFNDSFLIFERKWDSLAKE